MADGAMPWATYTCGESAAELEALQFTVGVGPGPDAYRYGVPIIESDLVALYLVCRPGSSMIRAGKSGSAGMAHCPFSCQWPGGCCRRYGRCMNL
jgi:hypothetical protein